MTNYRLTEDGLVTRFQISCGCSVNGAGKDCQKGLAAWKKHSEGSTLLWNATEDELDAAIKSSDELSLDWLNHLQGYDINTQEGDKAMTTKTVYIRYNCRQHGTALSSLCPSILSAALRALADHDQGRASFTGIYVGNVGYLQCMNEVRRFVYEKQAQLTVPYYRAMNGFIHYSLHNAALQQGYELHKYGTSYAVLTVSGQPGDYGKWNLISDHGVPEIVSRLAAHINTIVFPMPRVSIADFYDESKEKNIDDLYDDLYVALYAALKAKGIAC